MSVSLWIFRCSCRIESVHWPRQLMQQQRVSNGVSKQRTSAIGYGPTEGAGLDSARAAQMRACSGLNGGSGQQVDLVVICLCGIRNWWIWS